MLTGVINDVTGQLHMDVGNILYKLHKPVVCFVRQPEYLFHLGIRYFLTGLFMKPNPLPHNNYFAVFLI